MPKESYKPRHGYDIRVKPPGKKKTKKTQSSFADEIKRICEVEGCEEVAVVRSARSPRTPNDKIWLCAEHAREHNKKWNYFEGLSATEAQAAKESTIYGDRPTWSMGKNERARTAAAARGPADMHDAHGVFADAAKSFLEKRGHYREGRKLPALQVKAFETMDLKTSASSSDIRKRYAELVRRFHPDSNDGDRSAEAQLQEVVRAHAILKKAGYC